MAQVLHAEAVDCFALLMSKEEEAFQPHLAATCLDVPLEGLAQPLGLPTVNEGHLQPVVLRRGAAGRHVGNCAVRCPGNRRSVSRAAPR